MNEQARTVLVVEDDDVLAELLVTALKAHKVTAQSVGTLAEGFARLRQKDVDVLVTDYRLGLGEYCYELCREAAESNPPIPVWSLAAASMK